MQGISHGCPVLNPQGRLPPKHGTARRRSTAPQGAGARHRRAPEHGTDREPEHGTYRAPEHGTDRTPEHGTDTARRDTAPRRSTAPRYTEARHRGTAEARDRVTAEARPMHDR